MVRSVVALLATTTLAGCSLAGGGSGKAGGSAPKQRAFAGVVTIRYGAADPGIVQPEFFAELARVSHGHVRAVPVAYDTRAPDSDQRVARDLIAGKLDVADVATRAWEVFGVGGMRAFQSPFLISSDALLDRATADPRVAGPLLRSLAPLGVTGLAIVPVGVRYLFSSHAPLSSPEALAGARVRVSTSRLSDEIMRELRARPTSAIRNEGPVVAALERGRLDAVEADMHAAVNSGYIAAAPYVSAPIFAKANATVTNSARLRALGPQVTAWVRTAAERAAAQVREQDAAVDWEAACGGGLRVTPSTPAQIDALQRALFGVHAGLDGDAEAALAIDRIGLLAVRAPAGDRWAQCGDGARAASATRALDGAYEFDISPADEARVGAARGNDGHYRVEIGNGRYALLHSGTGGDPRRGAWDFERDPVEVGSVLIAGDVATLRPETALVERSRPKVYRFALFRDRLSWTHVSGTPDFLMSAHPWRKLGG
jgi:TRAP-type C4-dicarboxylate transport system substrate-binding protein